MSSKKQISSKRQELINLVDNIDFKVDIQGEQYIVLLKKQTDKQFSTLYLYDFKQIFWLKKIDLQFLQQLKEDLHINTNMQTFINCLTKSIKQQSQISITKQQASLTVKLQIGEGLTMNCIIKFTTKLSSTKDQKGFKLILKLFLRQLYQSNQSQQKSLRQQIEKYQKKKQEQQTNIREKDKKYINQVLNITEDKKDLNKIIKNRDLLNPNKVKRKQQGIKYNVSNK